MDSDHVQRMTRWVVSYPGEVQPHVLFVPSRGAARLWLLRFISPGGWYRQARRVPNGTTIEPSDLTHVGDELGAMRELLPPPPARRWALNPSTRRWHLIRRQSEKWRELTYEACCGREITPWWEGFIGSEPIESALVCSPCLSWLGEGDWPMTSDELYGPMPGAGS